ncbi:MAG: aconitase/3-isopropylmalate dehydratase large subunit family protein [Chloroflexi bacterium]|nr:aconitase/3-isopropylmalate dehydratase large subunit family protein [Chloroflexota bacterium]
MSEAESEIGNRKSEIGYTFAQKALARAAGLAHAEIGQIVDAAPDVVLSHDNTAAIAELFYSLGIARVRHPERLAIFLDHAVPAPTTEHAANHAEIRKFVREQGITHFYEAGRGICHQVTSEEALVLPGGLILGGDSHTTHAGWLGAFGAGIGRSEVAALWATGELWLRVPETIRVDLTGELPPGVTSKDLGLTVLKLLGPEAGIYRALEFGGPGLGSLSIAGRMVIPNLMAESGAKNAYMEPNQAVFEWLAERLAARTLLPPPSWGESTSPRSRGAGGALQAWIERLAAGALYPDADATYTARHTVNLSELEPVVACPHNPAKIVPLSKVAGTHVDQAFLGTCTNGRLEDLAAAAAILRGADGRVRQVAAGTRLVVIPASSEVLQGALAAGYIQTFVEAGAMIGVPGCGPCMGNHLGIPAPGEVTISSGNRNFRGRMGTAESEVYLASPAVVAASAVLGRIADPREVTG